MDKAGQHFSSGNVILPPITKGAPTGSSLKHPNDHRKRTIETEFGTIVFDGTQLAVHSNKTNVRTSSSSAALLLEPSEARPDEAVTTTPKLLEPPTEQLAMAMAFEQSRRQDSGVWLSDCEMMLFTLSSFLGFSCAVRGPLIWMRFGGGAFFVALSVCHLVITVPFLLLEAALGQFTGHGVAGFMPRMAPALQGYPTAMVFCLAVKTVSWMTTVSTVGIYVIEAVHHKPSWMNCNASFNSDRCYTYELDQSCQDRGALLHAAGRCVRREELCQPANGTGHQPAILNNLATACVRLRNGSTWLNRSELLGARELAASEFFYDVKYSDSDEHRLKARGRGILSLLGCWLLLALVSQAGLELVGYTLPLLLGLPACICLALVVHELVLGSGLSVWWGHLAPTMEQLSDYKCWLSAATSALLSTNIGMGMTSVIYARNAPDHDCQRSILTLIAINFMVNTLWPLFTIIMQARHAANTGKELKDVLRDLSAEPDLVMVTSSLGTAGGAQVWMALLFLMAFLLALGTAQAAVLTIETSLREVSVLTTMTTRSAVCLICSGGFLFGILLVVFPGSHHLKVAISTYAQSYFNIVLALVMVCAVNGTLGADRLLDALSQQMAVPLRRSRRVWALCWRYLCPLAVLCIFIFTVWHHATHPLRHHGAQLPRWTAMLAMALALAPLLLLLVGIFRASAAGGDVEGLYRPTERWRMGLHSPDTFAAIVGLGSGGVADGVPGPTMSLMSRVYGALSSRWLLSKGSLARLESHVMPIDEGPDGQRMGRDSSSDGPARLAAAAASTRDPRTADSKTAPNRQDPSTLG